MSYGSGVRFDFSPLRTIREGMGITQQALAGRAGIHWHTVHRAELNKTLPSLPQVVAMARALGVPYDRLFRVVD
jgi:DNA-binding XRE family transcriptional regulator